MMMAQGTIAQGMVTTTQEVIMVTTLTQGMVTDSQGTATHRMMMMAQGTMTQGMVTTTQEMTMVLTLTQGITIPRGIATQVLDRHPLGHRIRNCQVLNHQVLQPIQMQG